MAMEMPVQTRTLVFSVLRKLALLFRHPIKSFSILYKKLSILWRAIRALCMNRFRPSFFTKLMGNDVKNVSGIANALTCTRSPISGTIPYQRGHSEIIDGNGIKVSLAGTAYSMYPYSEGFSGDLLTTMPHISSPPDGSSAHNLSIPDDLQSTSFAQATRYPVLLSSNPNDCKHSTLDISRHLDSPCYLHHSRIKPMMPEQSSRYNAESRKCRGSHILDTADATIEVLTSPLIQQTPSQGWSELVHPEGGRYFHHKDKRLYTDADIYDATILDQLMNDECIITQFISENAIDIPEASELVIEISQVDGDMRTNYYFANHSSRGIFFLDIYEAGDFVINTPGQLRHYVEVQYWYHLNLYPDSLMLSSSLVKELKDIVLFFVGDSMTSEVSTSPFKTDVLYKILDITTSMEKSDCTSDSTIGAMTFIARFMHIFASSRYWNYAGEAHARLSRDQSIYGDSGSRRSWVISFLSYVLFFEPGAHLKKLQGLWVDQVAYAPCWEEMFKLLNTEWKGQILLAAIMLNANVGFLTMKEEDAHRTLSISPVQIATYISMATNIASIITGILLVKQTSSKQSWKDASEVQQYLYGRLHPRIGLEGTAILYSLPYAFLMWGILCFVVAFCLACFQHSDTTTRIIIASMCALIVVLSLWSFTAWGKLLTSNSSQNTQPNKAEPVDSKTSDAENFTKWALPGNQWIIYALSMLRRHSYDSEKTTVV